ncbi:MAG: hypothetical protein JSR19_00930 [Proteobacteria bacterium]|nr:hypothetical protein [Pseudomonadota bacterium]HQR03004.1 hypothetical protein [Rhodocyclaceae bacterium]
MPSVLSSNLCFPFLPGLWPGPEFAPAFKEAIESLGSGADNPLLTALGGGFYPADTPLTVSLLEVEEQAELLVIRVGVFYEVLLAGCACGDEPQAQSRYDEIEARLNRADGTLMLRASV